MSKNTVIADLEAREIGTREIPSFSPGDTVIVSVQVSDGNRQRIQKFEGLVIARRRRGMGSSFTVRKISHHQIGVERSFQTYSPSITEIEVKRRGVVRKAKLYYMRARRGRAARIKEKLG